MGKKKRQLLRVLVPWWFNPKSAFICVICGFLLCQPGALVGEGARDGRIAL
jgi:hypothetical protein